MEDNDKDDNNFKDISALELQPTQNKVSYLNFGQNLDKKFSFLKKFDFNENVRLPLNSIQTF